uniref:Uncharacterized protein n=1 Tax=Solanum lycopersicum TaxID=4081 RepID=A0A3Q7HA47_SOLLC
MKYDCIRLPKNLRVQDYGLGVKKGQNPLLDSQAHLSQPSLHLNPTQQRLFPALSFDPSLCCLLPLRDPVSLTRRNAILSNRPFLPSLAQRIFFCFLGKEIVPNPEFSLEFFATVYVPLRRLISTRPVRGSSKLQAGQYKVCKRSSSLDVLNSYSFSYGLDGAIFGLHGFPLEPCILAYCVMVLKKPYTSYIHILYTHIQVKIRTGSQMRNLS